MNLSPDLHQQLVSLVQELGVSIPPPVGIWFQTLVLVSSVLSLTGSDSVVLTFSACRSQHLSVSASGEDSDI